MTEQEKWKSTWKLILDQFYDHERRLIHIEELASQPSADKNWAEKIAIAKEAREAGKILRGQPSAAAEPATRLPVSMYEMLRAEGLSDERAWVYLDLLRSEKSDHAQESQPAPAGQAEPCAHPLAGNRESLKLVQGQLKCWGKCSQCDEWLWWVLVPAQAEARAQKLEASIEQLNRWNDYWRKKATEGL